MVVGSLRPGYFYGQVTSYRRVTVRTHDDLIGQAQYLTTSINYVGRCIALEGDLTPTREVTVLFCCWLSCRTMKRHVTYFTNGILTKIHNLFIINNQKFHTS